MTVFLSIIGFMIFSFLVALCAAKLIHNTSNYPVHDCPFCGYELVSYTNLTTDQAFPKNGDLVVCNHCWNYYLFDGDNE